MLKDADEVPVSYEVARKMLDEAETIIEINKAIILCTKSILREKFGIWMDGDGS